jgi:hypothetical protein
MKHDNGIRASMQYVMMQFSLPPTLMKQLMMMFDGLTKMSKQFLPSICPSSTVVSSSLMKLSSIFKNPTTILFVNLGSMGEKRCTT